jgi:hypothetical protein
VCPKCEITGFAADLKAATENPAVREKLAEAGLAVDEAAVEQFYQDMAPAAGVTPELSDEDCAHEKYATVENTSLLIADLEKQLTDVTNDRDELQEQLQAIQQRELEVAITKAIASEVEQKLFWRSSYYNCLRRLEEAELR